MKRAERDAVLQKQSLLFPFFPAQSKDVIDSCQGRGGLGYGASLHLDDLSAGRAGTFQFLCARAFPAQVLLLTLSSQSKITRILSLLE